MESQGDLNVEEQLLLQTRREIDSLLNAYKFDDIQNIPGFSLVDRRENRPGEDCAVYLFGKGKWLPDEVQRVMDTYQEVDTPEKGDILFWIDDAGNVDHMGTAINENSAVSKFGMAHVYEHPIRSVPTYYGNTIKAYRNPQEEE